MSREIRILPTSSVETLAVEFGKALNGLDATVKQLRESVASAHSNVNTLASNIESNLNVFEEQLQALQDAVLTLARRVQALESKPSKTVEGFVAKTRLR